MNHSFNTDIAKDYGIKEAILIENLAHWILKNEKNNRHLYHGFTWSYNSIQAYSDIFPYMSAKQIRYALQKLEDANIIKSGNFNKAGYDRTKWYTIIDKSICQLYKIHLPLWANAIDQEGETIPDINTDINQLKNKQKVSQPENKETLIHTVKEPIKDHFLRHFNQQRKQILKLDSRFNRVTYDSELKQLYNDYTFKELITALQGLFSQKGAIRAIYTPKHFLRDNNYETYLDARINKNRDLYQSQDKDTKKGML